MEENFRRLLSYKKYKPFKATPYVPEMIWHKLVLSVEEVTVTFALLALLDFYFSKNRSNIFNNFPSPKSLISISQAQNVSKSGMFSNR